MEYENLEQSQVKSEENAPKIKNRRHGASRDQAGEKRSSVVSPSEEAHEGGRK